MDRAANIHYKDTDHSETKLYGIGVWDDDSNQYKVPMDNSEIKATGCHTKFSRQPIGYMTMTKARYEARKRFGYSKLA